VARQLGALHPVRHRVRRLTGVAGSPSASSA
jgi:hypothetical protein